MGTEVDTPQAQSCGSRLRGPVLIIGAGLIGSSIGLALRARRIETVMDDRSAAAVEASVGIGAGRAFTAEDKEKNNAAADWKPFKPELVIVAAPPEVTSALVVKALNDWPQSIVIDVASVKSPIIASIVAAKGGSGISGDLSRYVGTHPMAGRERCGAVAAQRDLFFSMPWVIVPVEFPGTVGSSPGAVQVAENLVSECKAVPVRMGPSAHDQTAALVSHAPQVLASLMAARLCEAEDEALALTGQGLRDVTRIAASGPALWTQILAANAQSLVGILSSVRDDLDELIVSLRDIHAPGAAEAITRLLRAGNFGQARIPAKHGGKSAATAVIRVLVDDAVGQIAALLAEVEGLGINLEDLRVEHAQGRPVGVVEISVASAKAAWVSAALESKGRGSCSWKVLR